MEHLHDECLFPDVLRQKAGEIKNLIEERVHVLVDDPRLEHLFLVREEEEDDERTAGLGGRRGAPRYHGEVVGLLDVDGQHAALDVVIERELEGWVRLRSTLQGGYRAWEGRG